MATKLTLYIEEDIIDRAKRYSKDNGVSVSRLVSGYLASVTASDRSGALAERARDGAPRVSDRVRSLRGVVPRDTDAKGEYVGYIEGKYAK